MPALQIDLMASGMPAEQAILIGASSYTAVSAAGTTAGTATALTTSNSNVTTASSQTGVILNSNSALEKFYDVVNNSASTDTLLVYPPTGGNINGLGTNAAYSIPVGQAAIFMRHTTTVWSAIGANGSSAGTPGVAGQTASPRTVAVGGLVPSVSTDFTDATPVTTEVYLGEVLVPCNMTVTGVAVFNGSNVTGNVKFGLYDSTGALVAQTATTAGSGTDAYQRIAFTASYAAKGPATYYIGGSYSSATARYNAPPLGSFGASVSTGNVFGTLPTTVTPPTTFTTNVANIASLY